MHGFGLVIHGFMRLRSSCGIYVQLLLWSSNWAYNDPVLVAGFHQVRKALFDEGQGCRRILGLYIEDGSLWGLYPGLRVL